MKENKSERWGGPRPGSGRPSGPRKQLNIGNEMARLLWEMRQGRDISDDQVLRELSDLVIMISDWQALTNHAEVFAPELLHNERWSALKADLEKRTDEIGVTQFISQWRQHKKESET